MGPIIDANLLRELAGNEEFNATRLALNLSEFVNGVAQRHAETARELFPEFEVKSITNGIHPATWLHPGYAELYDARLPGWRSEPELLMRIEACVEPAEIWACHVAAKASLVETLQTTCGIELDVRLPIVGFGRRITAYKRPELLFTDLQRLESICKRHPFQVVVAGKAHPQDLDGKRAVQRLHEIRDSLASTVPMAFVPNYDMATAQLMVSGLDLWINTPQPPLEASGTSGMKAALNGVPNLSVLDGWWLEGHIEGVTGWAIGDHEIPASAAELHADSLYDKLERVILPLYADRPAWLAVMMGAIARNGSLFHSHRMMRRYAAEGYMA